MSKSMKGWDFDDDDKDGKDHDQSDRDDGDDDGHHGHHGGHGHHDHHGDHGKDDFDSNYELPSLFTLDLSHFNIKKLGKITGFDISDQHLSVTLGNKWTFSVDGHDIDITLKGKLPVVNGGTIDSFTVDGPGKADFSISGMDMSAKAFVKALVTLDSAKMMDLVLGGDETISGTGFGDYIFAGKGDDHIYGNKGHDWLMGGLGDDVIDGGRGNDYLVGGKGADTFVIIKPSGLDLIADFDASEDVLDLTALNYQGSVEDFLNDSIAGGHGGHHGWGHGWGHDRCHDSSDDSVVLDLGDGDKVKLDGVGRWDLNDQNVLL